MKNDSDLYIVLPAVLALMCGLYFGVFIGEMNTLYECKKDGWITIQGAFWKGKTLLDCRERTTHQ